MKWLSAVVALAVVAALTIASLTVHGFALRLEQDFWPLDASRIAPNVMATVVQWVILAIVMAIVYPPFRRWVESEIDHVHQKLDHVIKHHPDIPEFTKKERYDRNA